MHIEEMEFAYICIFTNPSESNRLAQKSYHWFIEFVGLVDEWSVPLLPNNNETTTKKRLMENI